MLDLWFKQATELPLDGFQGVMNFQWPLCSMQRMVCIPSRIAAIDRTDLDSSGLVSRICLIYDARIRATKQMNIMLCLDDSEPTPRRSSPSVPTTLDNGVHKGIVRNSYPI